MQQSETRLPCREDLRLKFEGCGACFRLSVSHRALDLRLSTNCNQQRISYPTPSIAAHAGIHSTWIYSPQLLDFSRIEIMKTVIMDGE